MPNALLAGFCGRSAVGKSALVRGLGSTLGIEVGFVRAITTRAQRPNEIGLDDNFRQYDFMSEAEARAQTDLLWLVPHLGAHYGMTRSAIAEARQRYDLAIFDLTWKTLLRLSDEFGYQIDLPFYFLAPDALEMARRMRERGDSEKSIRERLLHGLDWDEEVQTLDPPRFTIVPDFTSFEEKLEHVAGLIRAKLEAT